MVSCTQPQVQFSRHTITLCQRQTQVFSNNDSQNSPNKFLTKLFPRQLNQIQGHHTLFRVMDTVVDRSTVVRSTSQRQGKVLVGYLLSQLLHPGLVSDDVLRDALSRYRHVEPASKKVK
jgi:hypothetical protein